MFRLWFDQLLKNNQFGDIILPLLYFVFFPQVKKFKSVAEKFILRLNVFD